MPSDAWPLSVLMAAYNEEDCLERALESVLSQSYGDFEFIIVDDSSTDTTPEILAEYARRDARIRIIRNERNMRLPASLNVGLKVARAPLIARMDADDVALPTRFARQMEFMRDHPHVDVLGTSYHIPETGRLWFNAKDNELIKVRNLFCCEIVHPSVVIRKDTLLRFGGYPQVRLCEDYVLWARMCMARDVIFANLQDVLVSYSWANYLQADSEYSRLTQEMTNSVQIMLLQEGLGIELTEDEFLCHKWLCGFVSPEQMDKQQQAALVHWCHRLLEANTHSGLYCQASLKHELCRRNPLFQYA